MAARIERLTTLICLVQFAQRLPRDVGGAGQLLRSHIGVLCIGAVEMVDIVVDGDLDGVGGLVCGNGVKFELPRAVVVSSDDQVEVEWESSSGRNKVMVKWLSLPHHLSSPVHLPRPARPVRG